MECSGKESVSPSPHDGPPQAMEGGWGSLHWIITIFLGAAGAGQGDLHPQPCLCGSRASRGRVTARCRRQDVTSNLKRSCCRGGGRPGCWRGFRGTQCKHGCSCPSWLLPQPPVVLNISRVPRGTGNGQRGGDTTLCRAVSVTGENALMLSGVLLEWWHEGGPLSRVRTAPDPWNPPGDGFGSFGTIDGDPAAPQAPGGGEGGR